MTIRLIAGLFGLLIVIPVAAQQPEFKAGVELVTVPVTVTSNDHNTYIEGLTAADFRVTENGERQTVTTVTRERRPISVCFVIDSSGSMSLGDRRDLASQAVDRIVGQLKPDDEVSIVFFDEKVEERLPWTKVGPGVKLNWGGWTPRGSTALNDGMRLGFRLIEAASNARQRHRARDRRLREREPGIDREPGQVASAERNDHHRHRRRLATARGSAE